MDSWIHSASQPGRTRESRLSKWLDQDERTSTRSKCCLELRLDQCILVGPIQTQPKAFLLSRNDMSSSDGAQQIFRRHFPAWHLMSRLGSALQDPSQGFNQHCHEAKLLQAPADAQAPGEALNTIPKAGKRASAMEAPSIEAGEPVFSKTTLIQPLVLLPIFLLGCRNDSPSKRFLWD